MKLKILALIFLLFYSNTFSQNEWEEIGIILSSGYAQTGGAVAVSNDGFIIASSSVSPHYTTNLETDFGSNNFDGNVKVSRAVFDYTGQLTGWEQIGQELYGNNYQSPCYSIIN